MNWRRGLLSVVAIAVSLLLTVPGPGAAAAQAAPAAPFGLVDPFARTSVQWLLVPQIADWTAATNMYYADLWGNHAPADLEPTTAGPQIDIAQAYVAFVNSLILPSDGGRGTPISRIRPYIDALAAVDDRNKVEVLIPGTDAKTQVYPTRIVPSLADFKDQMLKGGTANPTAITVRQGQAVDTAPQRSWLTYGNFTYTVKAEGTRTFTIIRDGNWLRTDLLREYQNGPLQGRAPADFFGPDGSLKLIPTQLIVGYGVTVEINISRWGYDPDEPAATPEALADSLATQAAVTGLNVSVRSVADTITVTMGNQEDHNAYVLGVVSMRFRDSAQ